MLQNHHPHPTPPPSQGEGARWPLLPFARGKCRGCIPLSSPEDSVLEYANLGNFLVQIPLGHHWPLTPFDTICDIRFFRQRKFSPLFVKMAAINAETKITIIS
jgi:hypothetical protein